MNAKPKYYSATPINRPGNYSLGRKKLAEKYELPTLVWRFDSEYCRLQTKLELQFMFLRLSTYAVAV